MVKLKESIKVIVGILIGILLGLCISVSAATLIASNNVTYSNTNTSATNVKGALDELLNEKSQLNNRVKLGDYIQMTPASASYTITKELSGYTADQTINPSELKLWRVISINNDGTIDVVSEYTSSNMIRFDGYTGFVNYHEALVNIANSYKNSKYVNSARMIGLNLKEGQSSWFEENIYLGKQKTAKEAIDGFTINTNYKNVHYSWNSMTYQLYKDIHDIYKSVGSLNSPKMNNSSDYDGGYSYYTGAQEYHCIWSLRDNKYYCYGNNIFIDTEDDGIENDDSFINDNSCIQHSGSTKEELSSNYGNVFNSDYIRPILVLKSGITNFTGNGTASSPYVLS